MRRWVSLGGWCGPSLMLAKLGLCAADQSLAFDMVRCTLDGIVALTRDGFDHGYFPAPLSQRPFAADAVGIWLLFRSTHACFTHVDINDDAVVAALQRRIAAWQALLSPHDDGNRHTHGRHHRAGDVASDREHSAVPLVTFVRTVVATQPLDELQLLPHWHALVRAKTRHTLPFRTVLIVHEQAETTRPLCYYAAEAHVHGTPCVVWNLKRQRPPAAAATSNDDTAADNDDHTATSLLDRCHDGYARILTSMSSDAQWAALCGGGASLPTAEAWCARRDGALCWRPYTTLSHVCGLPAMRGSCRGFGSTLTAAAGRCVYCGSRDGHAHVVRDRAQAPPWRRDEDQVLRMQHVLHRGDEVATVEAAALALRRSAHDTRQRLRALRRDAALTST